MMLSFYLLQIVKFLILGGSNSPILRMSKLLKLPLPEGYRFPDYATTSFSSSV